jgi:hypothetical protein
MELCSAAQGAWKIWDHPRLRQVYELPILSALTWSTTVDLRNDPKSKIDLIRMHSCWRCDVRLFSLSSSCTDLLSTNLCRTSGTVISSKRGQTLKGECQWNLFDFPNLTAGYISVFWLLYIILGILGRLIPGTRSSFLLVLPSLSCVPFGSPVPTLSPG